MRIVVNHYGRTWDFLQSVFKKREVWSFWISSRKSYLETGVEPDLLSSSSSGRQVCFFNILRFLKVMDEMMLGDGKVLSL